jgi:hypothetical protein
MLVHLLGLLDLAAVGIMLGGHYALFKIPLFYAAIYLLTKIAFWRDWLSIVDACAAVYCILLFFGLGSGLTWFFVVYFVYKTSVWLFYTMAN